MFPQLKKINNESGIVLFIVLMVAIIMMIASVGILTQSMNETNYAQQQIDQIIADQLAKGIFWNAYSTAYSTGNYTNMPSSAFSVAVAGRSYDAHINPQQAAYAVSSNYDTFN